MSNRCRPKLAELTVALAGLSWSDVKCMAIYLHDTVDVSALDKIEQERLKSDERLIYCMHTWLQRDCEASWEKIVSALRKTKKNDIAKQIQSQYCASFRSCPPRSPKTLSPVELSLSDTDSAQRSDLPKEKLGPSQDLRAVVATGNGVNKISEESSRLEEHFVSVVTQANISFSEREAESPRFLNRLRITLTKLPICKKYEHMHFLKEEKDRFKAAQDVSDIFDILDPYWNHFDYKLLEHIIAQFGDDTLKRTMHEYVSDLEHFEKKTFIQDYIDATCSCHEIPPEFSTVLIEMDKKASECTLFDVRQFKESLANKSSLCGYALFVKKMGVGSVVITLAFPKDALDLIIEGVLEATFLDIHNITSVSIPDIPISEEEDCDGQNCEQVMKKQMFTFETFPEKYGQTSTPDGSQFQQNQEVSRPVRYYSQTSAMSSFSAMSKDSGMSDSNLPSPAASGTDEDELHPIRPSYLPLRSFSRFVQHTQWSSGIHSDRQSSSSQHTGQSDQTFESGYRSSKSEQGSGNVCSEQNITYHFLPPFPHPVAVHPQQMDKMAGYLVHQEDCQILECPCKQVKERFRQLLPQSRRYIQKEIEKVMERGSASDFDPSYCNEQTHISKKSQDNPDPVYNYSQSPPTSGLSVLSDSELSASKPPSPTVSSINGKDYLAGSEEHQEQSPPNTCALPQQPPSQSFTSASNIGALNLFGYTPEKTSTQSSCSDEHVKSVTPPYVPSRYHPHPLALQHLVPPQPTAGYASDEADEGDEDEVIDEVLLATIGCLMHQEYCRIPRCPCRQVKKRFRHLLPQTRSYMKKEADKVMEESSRGEFDPTDRKQQMRLSLTLQNISENIHPHYHMTSHSHIRQSKGMKRVLQRRRSRSVDLTPVVELPEPSAPTPALFPEAEKGLIPSQLFSPAVTPSGEQFRVLTPTTPSATQPPPVLLREISLSADNLPSLCLNDCPMAYTPLAQLGNRALGSGAQSPSIQRRWSASMADKPKNMPTIREHESTSSEEDNTSERLASQESSSSRQTNSTHSSGQSAKSEENSIFSTSSHHSPASQTFVVSDGSVVTETLC